MDFFKYQGAGNDFIITDNMDLGLKDKQALAARVCDRRFGIGADGFIAAEPSDTSDVKMAFYNADGSIAGMCGNGIRCFSKFVRDTGVVARSEFTVETGDGQKHVRIISRDGSVSQVMVDMGLCGEFKTVICSVKDSRETARLGAGDPAEGLSGAELEVYFAHMGVPHAVIFADTAGGGMEALNGLAERFGRQIEYAQPFAPERTNVNFVEIAGKDRILCSTWERGAGKTLACGTGACGSAAAACLFKGLGGPVRVTMPGGEVTVSFGGREPGSEGGESSGACKVCMQGAAVFTFRGSISD